MNPDILNAEIKGRFSAGLGTLLAATVLMGSGAFFMHVYHTSLKPLPNGAPDVVCWEMPQMELKRDGWRRVPEIDRQRIAFSAANGKAKIREETSLQCRQYQDGDARLFTAREWWYRTIR